MLANARCGLTRWAYYAGTIHNKFRQHQDAEKDKEKKSRHITTGFECAKSGHENQCDNEVRLLHSALGALPEDSLHDGGPDALIGEFVEDVAHKTAGPLCVVDKFQSVNSTVQATG